MMRKTTLFSMLFIGVLVGMLVIPKGANAVTFTLTQADLLNLALIDQTPATCCTFGTVVAGAGEAVDITWSSANIGAADVAEFRIGLFGSTQPPDLTGFDDFSLVMENTNDDDWEFRLWIVSGEAGAPDLTFAGGLADDSGYVFIAPGATATLTLALAGLTDISDIDGIGIDIRMGDFGIGTLVGCPKESCGGEGTISPIPEPATVLLLGSGLLGLLGIRRRRAA